MLRDIAAGDLIRDVLKRYDISEGEKRAYLAGNPEGRAQWDEARLASADSFLDEALELARSRAIAVYREDGEIARDKSGQPLIVRPDSGLVRAQVDTLKWAARIRNPQVFSDKAQLDVNVRTVDLTAIINAANARLAAARQPALLDGEAREVVDAALLSALPSVARATDLL